MGDLRIGRVVQFVEGHKWCGCFGFVEEIRHYEDDARVLIGVPMPSNKDNDGSPNTAYIYSMVSKHEFEIVGDALLMPVTEENDEWIY